MIGMDYIIPLWLAMLLVMKLVEITILFTTCGILLQSTEIGTMIYQEAIFGQRLR